MRERRTSHGIMRSGHLDATRWLYTCVYDVAARNEAKSHKSLGMMARLTGSRGLTRRIARPQPERRRRVFQTVDGE